MKRFLIICFSLLLFGLPVFAEKPDEGETIELQVLGEAVIIDGDLARARELAVANGLHQAVEQAVGSLVYSDTRVENYQLIKDSIRLRSAGYVSSYEINDVWVEQNICKTFLTVRIKQGTMIEDLAELRLNLKLAGNPRLQVLMTTRNRHLQTGGIETQLIDGLKKAGYQVVTASGEPVGEQNDILVQGVVSSEKLGSYQGLISCRVTIETQVVKADTGEVLTVHDIQQTGVDLTETSAAEKALRQAGEKLLPVLLTDLARVLTEPRVLTVEVANASYQQVMLLRQGLQETPMVDAVHLREFVGRKALIAVETMLTAPQLADELAGWPEMTIEITGVSQHLIELMVIAVGKP